MIDLKISLTINALLLKNAHCMLFIMFWSTFKSLFEILMSENAPDSADNLIGLYHAFKKENLHYGSADTFCYQYQMDMKLKFNFAM